MATLDWIILVVFSYVLQVLFNGWLSTKRIAHCNVFIMPEFLL